jgi:triphosphatase
MSSAPAPPGFETELKFQVPAGRRAAVLRALGAGSVQRVRMAARYFDTADGRLAAAGLALRLRREGRSRWVQTLKGRGDGVIQRLEHEVVLGAREPPRLDLARHDGTPVGAALREALAGDAPVERFAPDFVRTRRLVRTVGAAGAAQVELAFDEGQVRAGAATRALCELEFELRAGSPQALLALAARWVARHGLWLDVRSKAEVGHRLASGAPASVPVALPPLVSARMAPRRALAAMLQSGLSQVLPCMAEVAGPIEPAAAAAQTEALHQLRVGLRRTRTALREFGPGVDGVEPAWDGVLAEAFRMLGAQRDRDVVAEALAPARAAAGAAGCADTAPAPVPARPPDDVAVPLHGRAFNTVLLGLIGFVLAPPDTPGRGEAPAAPPLQRRARQRLKRLHRQVTEPASAFDTLTDEARHRLRKRAKRLRYALEFCVPLWGRKACARYLGPLRELQQGLGDLNDLALAEAWLAAQSPPTATHAFLRGWVAARRQTTGLQCRAALRAVAGSPRPWK